MRPKGETPIKLEAPERERAAGPPPVKLETVERERSATGVKLELPDPLKSENSPSVKVKLETDRKPEPVPFQRKETSPNNPLPPAFWDYTSRRAFLHHGGAKVFSVDWFPADRAKGSKSPLHVNFEIEGRKIIAHLHGVWPGALEIGATVPTRAPLVRPMLKLKAAPG